MEFAGVKVTERIAGAVLLLVSLAVLAILAAHGDTLAIVFLTMVVTLILIVVGGMGVLLAINAYNNWQSARFRESARENADIMLAQQKMQNQLTAGTLNYARSMQKMLQEPTAAPWELIEVDEGVIDTDIAMSQDEGW